MYKEKPYSAINPTYYRSHPSGVECIDIIRHLPFSQGNAIKYLWRAGEKGGPEKLREDLSKSLWYTTDAIVNEGWHSILSGVLPCGPKLLSNVELWSGAEPPGYRKECINNLLIGYPTKTQTTLEQWICELE